MNFYHELDLETVLQCPVCMEVPHNAIFLCKVGHHMCSKCRRRLTSCPTCQSALTSSRNFLAEALISKFSIFKNGSGDFTANNQLNKEHEFEANVTPAANSSDPGVSNLRDNPALLKPLGLPAGVFKCLLESCQNEKAMGVGDMYSHIESTHSQLYDKFQNKTGTFKHNFGNLCLKKKRRKYSRVMHISNMGLFFLVMQVLEDGYINCWISAPAPVTKTNSFDYSLEFVKKDDNINLQFNSKVASNLQSSDWLLRRGKVFVIPPTKHLLDYGTLFSLHVKIVYKKPSI